MISSTIKDEKASITLEAAFVLPMFIYAVLSISFLFQILEVQLTMNAAITETARTVSSYGYVYDRLRGNVSEETGAEQELLGYLKDIFIACTDAEGLSYLTGTKVNKKRLESIILNGWEGISFWGSSLCNDEECVEIYISYYIKIPWTEGLLEPIEFVQKVKMRCFSGTGEKTEENDAYVYVTANASVYHVSADCTYISIVTEKILLQQVVYRRNKSGGVYDPCELCARNITSDYVYITESGSRYHADENCSSLKRTVNRIKLSEVGELPVCSRCGTGK